MCGPAGAAAAAFDVMGFARDWLGNKKPT